MNEKGRVVQRTTRPFMHARWSVAEGIAAGTQKALLGENLRERHSGRIERQRHSPRARANHFTGELHVAPAPKDQSSAERRPESRNPAVLHFVAQAALGTVDHLVRESADL